MSGDQLSQAEIENLLKAATQGAKPGGAGSQAGGSGTAESATGMPSSSDSGGALSQDEIEKLLQQAGRGTGTVTPPDPKEKGSPSTAERSEQQPHAEIHPADLDYLFHQAEQAPGVSAFQFTEFTGAPPSTQAATLDLLKEVELDVRIELGQTRMYLEDVLRLRKGTVVTLDKLAGDPVDIYVNGRLVARGEVLVLNDNFCIRVAELIAGKEPHVKDDA